MPSAVFLKCFRCNHDDVTCPCVCIQAVHGRAEGGMPRQNGKIILQLELHTGCIKRAVVTKVRYGGRYVYRGIGVAV